MVMFAPATRDVTLCEGRAVSYEIARTALDPRMVTPWLKQP